jgi:hypothetical protein
MELDVRVRGYVSLSDGWTLVHVRVLASEMRLVIGILESSERECTFGSWGSSGRRRGRLSAIHHNIHVCSSQNGARRPMVMVVTCHSMAMAISYLIGRDGQR